MAVSMASVEIRNQAFESQKFASMDPVGKDVLTGLEIYKLVYPYVHIMLEQLDYHCSKFHVPTSTLC